MGDGLFSLWQIEGFAIIAIYFRFRSDLENRLSDLPQLLKPAIVYTMHKQLYPADLASS